MGIEFEEVIKKSFTLWNHDSKTWKYILGIYATSLGFFVIIALLLFLLFGPVISQIMANPDSLQDPAFALGVLPSVLSNLLILFVVFLPLFFLYIFVNAYLSALIHVRALQLNKFTTAEFSITKLIKLFFLGIYASIVAFLSLYNKTLLILTLVYIALAFFTFLLLYFIPDVALIFGMIMLLLAFPYMAIVFYNSYRLSLAPSIFLHKNIGITNATKESWDLSKGNVLMIFVTSLILGIIIGVISFIFEAIGQVFGSIIDLVAGTVFFAIILSMIFSFIISPIVRVIYVYMLPTIYAQLLTPKAAVMPQTQSKPTAIRAQPKSKPFPGKSKLKAKINKSRPYESPFEYGK